MEMDEYFSQLFISAICFILIVTITFCLTCYIIQWLCKSRQGKRGNNNDAMFPFLMKQSTFPTSIFVIICYICICLIFISFEKESESEFLNSNPICALQVLALCILKQRETF